MTLCAYRLRFARVLDRVLRDASGKRFPGKWLRVLALADTGTYGYIRYISIEDIDHCRTGTGAFFQWFHIRYISIEDIDHCRTGTGAFFQWFLSDGPAQIAPDTIEAMHHYGSLSEDSHE
jgi:hypothetical protein